MLFLRIITIIFGKTSYAMRLKFDNLLPANLLSNSYINPGIQIMIPCHAKDIRKLPLVIFSLIKNCENQILEFVLISNVALDIHWQIRLKKICEKITINFITEEEYFRNLGTNFESSISAEVFQQGWIKQQPIKIIYVYNSNTDAVLIWDADTLLNQSHFFYDGSKQTLSIIYGFKPIYEQQFKDYFLMKNSIAFSFVTHYQLMQPFVIRDMFRQGASDIVNWILSSNLNEIETFSEYHTYGSYIFNKYRNKVAMTKWANLGIVLEEKYFTNQPEISMQELHLKYKNYKSISSHHWMEKKAHS